MNATIWPVRIAAAAAVATLVACGSSSTGPDTSGVRSVAVSPATATVTVGGTTQFSATPEDASGAPVPGVTVHWSSENTQVATVDGSGNVTGVALGSTRISASANGESGIATLTVSPKPVASVTVAPPADTLVIGDSVQLGATALDADGHPVGDGTFAWASSNTSVAIVSSAGLVYSRGIGSASISATSGGKTGTAAITVIDVPVGSVVVNPPTANVFVGDSTQLTATVRDSHGNTLTGRPVTWASDNTAAATVSGSGMVTAVGPGVANISASSGGKSGTSVITAVPVPVASVSVTPSSSNIGPLSSVQLTATTMDARGNTLLGRAIAWSSSKPNIASVDSTGLVQSGILGGTATISATSENVSGTATVKVSLRIGGNVETAPAAP